MAPGTSEPAPGRLLVATPALTDGPFARSVVQLLQYSCSDGGLGLVLTSPTSVALDDVLPGWSLLAPDPAVVFDGGPVQESVAVCLGWLRAGAGPSSTYLTVPGAPWLATVDLDADLSSGLGPVEQVRVFAGYAGWAPGQLEDEVEQGGWWALDALPGDAFTGRPDLLWRQVLARQDMPLALAASYPADPTLN